MNNLNECLSSNCHTPESSIAVILFVGIVFGFAAFIIWIAGKDLRKDLDQL
jgi:hypothetical protein